MLFDLRHTSRSNVGESAIVPMIIHTAFFTSLL